MGLPRAICTLSDLKASPDNPRLIGNEALEGLKCSIESFGDLSGIVWNERTGHLVCGHQRVRALTEKYGNLKITGNEIKAGKEVFSIRVVKWNEQKERAANIAANSPYISGEFEQESLKLQLQLIEAEDVEMFAKLRLNEFDLLEQGELPEPSILEPPVNPVVKRGDLFRLGEHRVLCGDSTIAEDVEKVLNGEKVEIMVTDPPYGVEYDANWRNDAAKNGSIIHGARRVGKVQNDDRADWNAVYALINAEIVYVWHAGKFSALAMLVCGEKRENW